MLSVTDSSTEAGDISATPTQATSALWMRPSRMAGSFSNPTTTSLRLRAASHSEVGGTVLNFYSIRVYCLVYNITIIDTAGQTQRRLPMNVGPSGFQSFTIMSVLDAKTGEDLSVAEAVRRGILDHSKRNYRDSLTGETMVLDTAVKRSQ